MISWFSEASPLLTSVMLYSLLPCILCVGVLASRKFVERRKIDFTLGFLSLLFTFLLVGSFTIRVVAFYYLDVELGRMLRDEQVKVTVNGKELKEAQQFLTDFQNEVIIKRSGSSPVQGIEVVVSVRGEYLTFCFKTDSRDEDFYWVYFPDYKFHVHYQFIRTDQLASARDGFSIDMC